MNFAQALKWSFLAEVASKLIQPVTFVILARLLTPQDFGVMAAAFMVVGLSQIFWEAGMGKALIQRQADVREAANVSFWINISLGVIISILLLSCAGYVATYAFRDGRVTVVLQVMSLHALLGAASSVHIALLQKNMQFKRLFWIRFAAVSLPGLASIPFAWIGMGYWALVAGTLIGQLAQLAMLWRLSDWRPTWSFNATIALDLSRFGFWVLASGLLTWFYAWADSFIVGMRLGGHELGIYRSGSQFAAMIFAIAFAPITPVLYSYLSQLSRDQERLRSAVTKIMKVLSLSAIPLGVIIFANSERMASIIFGEKWSGIGFVIAVMALMHGYSWIVGMNGEAYAAAGKPIYATVATALPVPAYLVVYLVTIDHGFHNFIWARLVVMFVVALPAHFYIASRFLKCDVFDVIFFSLQITAISLVAILIERKVASQTSDDLLVLLISVTGSMLVIGAVIYLWQRRKLVLDILTIVSGLKRAAEE